MSILFFLTLAALLVVTVPIVLVTLLVWPESRTIAKSLVVRASQFALVGLFVLIVFGSKFDQERRASLQPRSEPAKPASETPLTVVSDRDEAVTTTSPAAQNSRLHPLVTTGDEADSTASVSMFQPAVLERLVIMPVFLVLLGLLAVAFGKRSHGPHRTSGMAWGGAVALLLVVAFLWVRGADSPRITQVATRQAQAVEVPQRLAVAADDLSTRPATDLLSSILAAEGESEIPVDSVPAPLPSETAPHLPSPISILTFTGDDPQGQAVKELPGWVQDWETSGIEPDGEKYVLTSRRYATVAEAEDELLAKLRPRLTSYLSRGGTPMLPAQLTLDDIRRSAAVAARVQETFQVELGTSVEPVFRVTWKVWLRPSVRETLGESWRIVQRQERLWKIGGLFGGLTLLFGTAAFALHQGRARS